MLSIDMFGCRVGHTPVRRSRPIINPDLNGPVRRWRSFPAQRRHAFEVRRVYAGTG